MRASKLIMISTAAVLMGGMSLAIGQGAGSLQSGDPTQAAPTIGHGSARGAEPKAYQRQAAETPMRAAQGRALAPQRGQVFTTERAQAITGQPKTARQIQGQPQSRMRQSLGEPGTRGLTQARASNREFGVTAEQRLTPEQRQRVQEFLAARRDIPRANNLLPGDIRVNALVPRGVRLVAIPAEVARAFPRLRGDRVFMRGDRVVIVNPTTSRIVAVL